MLNWCILRHTQYFASLCKYKFYGFFKLTMIKLFVPFSGKVNLQGQWNCKGGCSIEVEEHLGAKSVTIGICNFFYGRRHDPDLLHSTQNY